MADLNAYRGDVEMWRGDEKSVTKNYTQTRYNRLNKDLILQMIEEHPEFRKCLVFDVAASANSTSTHLIGTFSCECKKLKPVPDEDHKWASGKVFTEIFVADGADDTMCQFDVIVWNQKCKRCKTKVSCDINEETYRERVFSKLLLLLGLRDSIPRSDSDERRTAPHVSSMCCACKAGKCLRNNY